MQAGGRAREGGDVADRGGVADEAVDHGRGDGGRTARAALALDHLAVGCQD